MKTQTVLFSKICLLLFLFLAATNLKAEIKGDTLSPSALSFLQAPPDASLKPIPTQSQAFVIPGAGYGHNIQLSEFFQIDPQDPGSQFAIYPFATLTASGDFAPGDPYTMYLISLSGNTLLTMDINDGTVLNTVSLAMPLAGGAWTVLAINKVSGIFYAVATTGAESMLYSIDPVSGSSSLVMDLGIPAVISGSFDGGDNLYLFDILQDNIWTVNVGVPVLSMESALLLGPAGFDGSYSQGMGYSPLMDEVLLAAYNTSAGPQLRQLDRTTGLTTLMANLPGETTAFGFPFEEQGDDDFLMAGQDLYTIPAASLLMGEDLPPIPQGFFDPGSEPFIGNISLTGQNSNGGQLPNVDLVISRMGDIPTPAPLPSGGEVQIEIVQLNLSSTQPIVVQTGTGESLWDVELLLVPSMPQQGNLSATKQNLNGGDFFMQLLLMPELVFTEVENPDNVRVFTPSEFGFPGLQLFSGNPLPWMAPPIAHEFDPFWDGGRSLQTDAGSEFVLVPLLKRQDNAFLSMNEEGQPEEWEGSGYNNSLWYYYPFTDWWNVWFYDHPLAVDRRKFVGGVFTIIPRDPSQPSYVEVILGWSTPEWPTWNGFPEQASPPLPDMLESPEMEQMMIERTESMYTYEGNITEEVTVDIPADLINTTTGLFNYNPEWIFVDVRGYNFMIYNELDHICFKPWPTCEVICPEDMEVCATDAPFTLSGASPAGGTYSGNGVDANGTFNPGQASWGNNTITYSYVCPDGTVVTCTFTIYVIPPPEMVCPYNMIVCLSDGLISLPSGEPGGGSFSGPGISGNTFSTIQAGVGTHTITYSVTDPCPGSCTFTITVHPPPEVDCPDDFEMCEDDAPIDMMTLVSPQGGSFGGGQIYDPSTAPPGVPIQIKYTYTDANGCTASCVFYITVWPNPDVDCPDDMEMCIDDGPVTLSASPAGGTFSGPGIGGDSFNPANAGVGIHTIEYCYTDPQTGCEGCCEFTISVNPPPEMVCPPNLELCYSDNVVSIPDGIPGGGTFAGPGMVGGNSFSTIQAGVGTHTITYSVTEPCPGSCTFTITVHPNPEVDCPADFEMCESDNPIDLMTLVSPQGGTFSGGQIFDPGSSVGGPWQIKYTYTDANGCSASCVFYITVHPTPDIECPDDFTMCEDDAPIDMMTLVNPQGGSFGGGQIYDPSTAPLGVPIQIKYTYTDANGCTASCVFYITVWPNPDVDCPDDMEMCIDDDPIGLTAAPAGGTFAGPGIGGNSFNPANAGVGTHTIEYCYTDPQTGCEGCCEFTITVHPLPDVECPDDIEKCIDDPAFALSGATPAGGTYSGPGVVGGNFNPAAGAGVKTITYTYTDPQTGCSNSCTFKITVHPLPDVTCPGNISKCIDDPAFALGGAAPAGGTYFDFWGNPFVNFNPAAWGVGVHTIYYDYTDPDTGCSNWCWFTITVNPLPVVTCPGNITVCLNDPAFALGGAAPAGGTYSDFWGNPVVNFNPAAWGVGMHAIFYDYTDPNTGCSNWCMFTITVLALPNVTCPANMTVCIDDGLVALAGAMPAGGVYAGPGVAGGNFNPLAAGAGAHNITYTYTDPATGCSNSCTFTITVNPLPNVTCPPNMTVCIDDGLVALAGAMPAGGVYAGPGVAGGNFNPLAAGAGAHNITYTYTDPATGCSNSCTFTIAVIDPNVNCPPNQVVCENDSAFILSGAIPAGGVYSGIGVSLVGGNYVFNPSVWGPGTVTIQYVYTVPGTNCSDTCDFDIIINEKPDVDCPPNDTICESDPDFALVGGAPAGGVYKLNGNPVIIFKPSWGPGTYPITYTYTNAVGCADSCTFSIVVRPDPVAVCPANMIVNLNDPAFALAGGAPAGGVYTDAAGNAIAVFNPAAAGLGVHTITYTYTDEYGCSDSCTFTITVFDQGDSLDFGDAPDHIPGFDYHTRMVNNGARHVINPDVFLGNLIDAEADGQPDMNALGDDKNNLDDEDGVRFRRLMAVGDVAIISVKASVDGFLNAWIDYNQDGDWSDAGEQIFSDQLLVAGWNTLSYMVPASAQKGRTYARFRFNTYGGLSFEGLAENGEVEDYRVAILPEDWAYEPTDMSHIIVVPQDLGNVLLAGESFMLEPNDIIGAFYGIRAGLACGGAILYDGIDNQTLMTFGNDPLTGEKDGFDEGETFGFKVYRPATGEEFDVEATFDPAMPNSDGKFYNNGMSAFSALNLAGLSQTLAIAEGWSGISTWLEPLDTDVENMFSPIVNNLEILYNEDGMYWPGENINSMVLWNTYMGSAIKMTADAVLVVNGNALTDVSVDLAVGWNNVPVLSAEPFDVEMLFSTLPGFVAAKDVAGLGVYLPGYGINTIGNMIPGSAYYAYTTQAGTVSFISIEVKSPVEYSIPSKPVSPWNEISYTPESHIVVFNSPDAPFMDGDIVGGFTSDGYAAGVTEVRTDKAFALTLNGNDVFTDQKTGFDEGELLTYKVHRPSTGESFALEVMYNPAMTLGNFTANGISEVMEVKASALGVDNLSVSQISIYPNPSSGKFNITGVDGLAEIEVRNAYGKLMIRQTLDIRQGLDLSAYPNGVYLLKITTNNGVESMHKLIVH